MMCLDIIYIFAILVKTPARFDRHQILWEKWEQNISHFIVNQGMGNSGHEIIGTCFRLLCDLVNQHQAETKNGEVYRASCT